MFASTRSCASAALVALSLSAVFGSAARAAIVPFTEDFATDAAGWRDSAGTASLSWQSAGGPDGGSFVSGVFNFANSATDDTVVQFRGQDEFGSSGGAFVGNWIADGVSEFTAYVRHDAGVPLNFFVRFSGPANFPGGTAVSFAPVPTGTWAPITIPIDASNPQFVSFEGTDFDTVFGNVGHVQIGVSVPEGLAGVDAPVSFDLDKVAIVPEPAVLTLLCVGATVGLLRRRQGMRT